MKFHKMKFKTMSLRKLKRKKVVIGILFGIIAYILAKTIGKEVNYLLDKYDSAMFDEE